MIEYLIKLKLILKGKLGKEIKIGLAILTSLIVFGLVSFYAPPNFERWFHLPADNPPRLTIDPNYILGTTTNGRSVFWTLTRAVLNSLTIGFVASIIAVNIGFLMGILAGYIRGFSSRIITFITDTIICIPSLPLYIVLGLMLKKYMTLPLLGVLIAIPLWTWPARIVRSVILPLVEREFIYIARLSGESSMKIIIHEILPHLTGYYFLSIANTLLGAIGAETGLAILGVSTLEKDTLGTMLYWSRHFAAIYRGIWWWYILPIIILIILFLSLYLIIIGINKRLGLHR